MLKWKSGLLVLSLCLTLSKVSAACETCLVDESPDLSFYSEEPGKDKFESAEYKYGAPFLQFKVKDESGARPTGFEFTMNGPNSIAVKPLVPDQPITRRWQFVTTKGSRRETYLLITDDAGSGYLSQLMETAIVLIPRKHRPHIQEVGDEFHVTLTTGEKVIYDKNMLIKSGVFKEGPLDLNPDRFKRKFVPLTYSGTGISIRMDKRGEEPRITTGNATITQNGKSCKVPTHELWVNPSAQFKFPSDEKLLQRLNQICPVKFSIN